MKVPISPGCFVFTDALGGLEDAVLAGLALVERQAPLREVTAPFGRMSVRITNAGDWGWYAHQNGYTYESTDPRGGAPWPPMPEAWLKLASHYAAEAGFENFLPDSCLVNEYTSRSTLGPHVDRDEVDFTQPIVSVSLGADARFAWGGLQRNDPTRTIVLEHGDVLVFGGPDRMRHHAIREVADQKHPKLGFRRVNLTFRKAK